MMNLTATTAALLTVTAGGAFGAEVTARRLFVADRDEAKVSVVDATGGAILDTFPLKGPAALYRSESGETVFAVQGDAGAVTALSTGVALDDHGDHGDIAIEAPKLTGPSSMDGAQTDPRPRIAVTGDQIFVTDPLGGKPRAVDAATFAEAGEIAVTGKPHDIVAADGSGEAPAHDEVHDGAHAHDHGDEQVYKGYFENAQIAERTLADWEGEWQSVYPYLRDGALDPVMARKAEHGDKSAADYEAYYEAGYRTDVDRITIDGDLVTFVRAGTPFAARYASDGYEILTYEKGNRGVRFIFEKVAGDAAAPRFIQFSDHRIAPAAADHYHLYWGDDRAAVLAELTNWPTYYPASMNADEIVAEMNAH